MKIANYEVKQLTIFENNKGFIFAENPQAVQPFVTWQFTKNENGEYDCYWGHYFVNLKDAMENFNTRVDIYCNDYGLIPS